MSISFSILFFVCVLFLLLLNYNLEFSKHNDRGNGYDVGEWNNGEFSKWR